MALTKEEVAHIAALARINLTSEELQRFGGQLSSILEYVAMLQEVNTEGVMATSQITGLSNVARLDELLPSDPEIRKRIIEAFPMKEGDLLKVKKVL